MIRNIITIDEKLCDGWQQCVPECRKGAFQIINGKARLLSDVFHDGLGTCIGRCSTGALTIEKRKVKPYDERKVMDYIIRGGSDVIKAHLIHLKEHGQYDYLNEAVQYLKEMGIEVPNVIKHSKDIPKEKPGGAVLNQWPIQMHLILSLSPYFVNSDLLLSADCCGFARRDFYNSFFEKQESCNRLSQT